MKKHKIEKGELVDCQVADISKLDSYYDKLKTIKNCSGILTVEKVWEDGDVGGSFLPDYTVLPMVIGDTLHDDLLFYKATVKVVV